MSLRIASEREGIDSCCRRKFSIRFNKSSGIIKLIMGCFVGITGRYQLSYFMSKKCLIRALGLYNIRTHTPKGPKHRQ